MFEELSEKLDTVLGRFRKRGLLTEPMIREATGVVPGLALSAAGALALLALLFVAPRCWRLAEVPASSAPGR